MSKQDKTSILENNTNIAALGLLGFEVKKLAPSKENKKRFDDQFNNHQLCGCVGCIDLAKIFIDKMPDIKEAIIVESMIEMRALKIK